MLTCEIGILCKNVLSEYTGFYVNVKYERTMALLTERALYPSFSLKTAPPKPPLDTQMPSLQKDMQTFAVFRDVARVH